MTRFYNSWDPDEYDSSLGFVAGHGQRVLDMLGNVEAIDVSIGVRDGAPDRPAGRGRGPAGRSGPLARMVAAARTAHADLDIRVGDAQEMTLQSLIAPTRSTFVFSNAALHWMPDGEAVASAQPQPACGRAAGTSDYRRLQFVAEAFAD